MLETSPPEYCFALDLQGLKAPDVTVWSVWSASEVVGVGALKDHGGGHGELKSMRTDPRFVRQGVATALLAHILAEARGRGLRRLSLETGVGPAFEAALALYLKHGFQEGPPFADYRPSPFNRFLHRAL